MQAARILYTRVQFVHILYMCTLHVCYVERNICAAHILRLSIFVRVYSRNGNCSPGVEGEISPIYLRWEGGWSSVRRGWISEVGFQGEGWSLGGVELKGEGLTMEDIS